MVQGLSASAEFANSLDAECEREESRVTPGFWPEGLEVTLTEVRGAGW